jgi:hypothetical protein
VCDVLKRRLSSLGRSGMIGPCSIAPSILSTVLRLRGPRGPVAQSLRSRGLCAERSVMDAEGIASLSQEEADVLLWLGQEWAPGSNARAMFLAVAARVIGTDRCRAALKQFTDERVPRFQLIPGDRNA